MRRVMDFFLSGGVRKDLAELTIGDEFQNNGPSNESGQHFFNALFAHDLAEVDQQGGLARPGVIKASQAE
jgi:hypothetical protein